jgi:hypothetical protein
MSSQFDEIAKAVARGVSRRRALRGLLGGIAGAVAASLWASSRASSAEAVQAEASPAMLQQAPRPKPRWNASNPSINGRFNQTRPGINGRITWNQRHPTLNQTVNQHRRRINQSMGNRGSRDPNAIRARFNQNGSAHLNQVRSFLQQRGGGPTLNMVRGPRFGRP